MTIIVARFNEDISWLADLHEQYIAFVYEKGTPQPWTPKWAILNNSGREAGTFLYFITTHYNQLVDDEYIFCQANPFDHDKDFLEHIKDPEIRTYGAILGCDPNGQPQCDWTDLHSLSKVLGLPLMDEYRFVQGSQFRLTAEQIKNRPIEFYEACLAITKINELSPYCFERLWNEIFGLNL